MSNALEAFEGNIAEKDHKDFINSKSKETEANDFCHEFPRVIPGAGNIEIHEAPSAKYCLIHIRDPHPLSGDTDEDIRMKYQADEDIYKILDFLKVEEIFVEADESKVLEGNRDYKKLREELKIKEAEIVSADLQKPYENYLNALRRMLLIYRNAAERLHDEGKIKKLIPAESSKLMAKARAAEERKEKLLQEVEKYEFGSQEWKEKIRELGIASFEYENFVIKQREAALVENFKEGGLSIRYLILGSSHSLADDVARYNMKHQKGKISVIIITPQALFNNEKR